MHQSQPLKTTVSWNLPKLGLGCLPTPAKCLTTRPWWYLENWKHTHTCMHTHLILCQRLSDYFLMSPTLSQGKKNKSIKTHCSDMFHLFYFSPLSIGLPFTGGRGVGGGGGEKIWNLPTKLTLTHPLLLFMEFRTLLWMWKCGSFCWMNEWPLWFLLQFWSVLFTYPAIDYWLILLPYAM